MKLRCPKCKYNGKMEDCPTDGIEIECEECGHVWTYRSPRIKPTKAISSALFAVVVLSSIPLLLWGVQSSSDSQDQSENLPLNTRKEIYIQLMRADDWAHAYSFKKTPPSLSEPPVIGRVYQLRKKLPMVRITKPEKHASEDFKTLPEGMIIKIIKPIKNDRYSKYQVKIGRHNNEWMFTGRIVDLNRKQVKPPEKRIFDIRNAYKEKLLEKYRDQIADHYNTTVLKLEDIAVEGYEKDWPEQKLPLTFKPD